MLRFQSQIIVDNLPDEMLDNKWECIMPSLDLSTIVGGIPYQPIVEEVVFRGTSFSNEEFRTATRFYNLPQDRQSFGECMITLFCEQGMLPVYYLQTWRNAMFDPVHQYYYVNSESKNNDLYKTLSNIKEVKDNMTLNAMSNWKKDIEIYFYGVGGILPIAHATLRDAYPVSQGDYSLKYSQDPKRFRINATFRYDNVIWDSKYRNEAIISALLAGNPIGTIAQQALGQLDSLMVDNATTDHSAI